MNDNNKPISANTLMEYLQNSITNATFWANKVFLSDDAVYCLWPGQTDDGRKRKGKDNKIPWPWVGASDTRIRTAYSKCEEIQSLCLNAYKHARIEFNGVDSFDFIKAAKMNQLLKWQINNQMDKNSKRQLKLATKWMIRYGLAFLSCSWEKKVLLDLIDISTLDLAGKLGIDAELWSKYIENPQAFIDSASNAEETELIKKCASLYVLLSDISQKETLSDTIRQLYPSTNEALSKTAAEELISTGQTKVAVERVVREAPTWNAYFPFKNIFFPTNTTDLNKSPWVAIRQWCSAEDIKSSEYSEEFKTELLKHPGISITETIDNVRRKSYKWKGKSPSNFLTSNDTSNMFELFECYYKVVENGVLQIRKCVISNGAKASDGTYICGLDEVYDSYTDEYPFITFELNPEDDCLLDNIGLPYLLYTQQQEIKNCRDARINAMDIATLPPMRRNIRDKDRPVTIGPDMPIYESVANTTDWLRPPENRNFMSVEIEEAVKNDIDAIAGTYNSRLPAQSTSIRQADLISNYLEIMQNLLNATFKLNQLYLPLTTITRISGIVPEAFSISKDEIQGQFDIYLSFDSREIDAEYSIKKSTALMELLKMDYNGIIDRNKLVMLVANMIDPDWAEKLITDENAGAMKEIRDEQNNVALIMTGQEPPMKQGVNAKIRLEYLSKITQQSPEIAEALQQKPFVKALLENRAKFLQFQIQQQQNAIIGKLGTKELLNG